MDKHEKKYKSWIAFFMSILILEICALIGYILGLIPRVNLNFLVFLIILPCFTVGALFIVAILNYSNNKSRKRNDINRNDINSQK